MAEECCGGGSDADFVHALPGQGLADVTVHAAGGEFRSAGVEIVDGALEGAVISAFETFPHESQPLTATCSFAAYDDPSVVSPADYAMLNPKGGAIALMSTTRAVYTNSNKLLTDGVHDLMYKKINGKAPTLGYILAEGKNKYQGEFFRVNSRKFALLGDPSLAVAMPKHNIYTSKVNGKDATSVTDTINALEKVTIEGFVGNENGDIISGFNGTIYPTIYDKIYSQDTFQ